MEGNMTKWKLTSVEDQIIKAVISLFLHDGFVLSVYDGEEFVVRSRNPGLIFTAMKSTDEDYLYIFKVGDKNPNSAGIGWVRFVYGNGETDVICDYTVNLEPWLKEITEMVNDYEK